ncbi:PAS domain S-box protein [Methylocystis heyeri]|uniref:histidine kinase n=2 Tax=Methylocystis heyeri TaxID=391905 RepID=A0A6B8KLT0_9HYPH|nr:PAS domain S-box protein [Methylocystis heyeri]
MLELLSGSLGLPDDAQTENIWPEVVRKVDEVYSDLIRYEADLESKNAELEEAQQFISSVIACVSDILVVSDEKGLIVQVNPAFQRLIGLDEDSLRGASLADYILAEDRSVLRRIAHGGEGNVTECELRFLCVDGVARLMAVNCSARFDHAGRRVGAVLTGRPIGELRRAYEALHNAHIELQQAQRTLIEQEKMASIGRLVAGVAHELNNPISFIYGNVHALEKYRRSLSDYFAQTGEKTRQSEAWRAHRIDAILADLPSLTEGMMEGAVRISEIVRNLRRLSFSRPAEIQRIDLERMARTAANWASRSKHRRADILFDCEPGVVAEAHEGQMHQVLVNLIVNAFDAAESVAEPRIRVAIRNLGGEAEIVVEDNGHGFAEGVADKIFEPFFTTKSVGEGTGLGLWVSYSIIKEHGGSIVAANRAGGGAVLTVRLPIDGARTPGGAQERI